MLKERFGWYGWAGAALILSAAIVSELTPPKTAVNDA